MSEKVMSDLRQFQKTKPAQLVQHPLYDNFGAIISKTEAREKLGIGNEELVLLFFGFIRKYKGLDLLLEAMKILKEKIIASDSPTPIPKLLITGEFYEEEKQYKELIEQLGISEQLILRTEFIP